MSAGGFGEEMRAAGRPVSEWSNGPGYRYGAHSHPYEKVLCCLEGGIVFGLADREVPLAVGDRMVIEPGARHSASVGPDGVRCAEAHFREP